MLDLWLWQLKAVAPLVGGLCFSNFMEKQGELCNFRQPRASVLQYAKPNPEAACYRDGIFYPRCKDLENPEVLYYHNLLKNGTVTTNPRTSP
jgi:hypothetical protein